MFDYMRNTDGLNVVRFEFPSQGKELLSDVVWLDVECDKIAAPVNWPYRTRTRAFMVGVGFYVPGAFVIEVVTGSEASVMEYVAVICEGAEVRYTATRQYDKLVVEGRWTYARRGPSSIPGDWPNVQNLDWVNIRNEPKRSVPVVRSADIASADIPKVWPDLVDTILLHNVRDVLLMVMEDRTAVPFRYDPKIIESEVPEAVEALLGYRN